MKTYNIVTAYGTQYTIDQDGCFLRYDTNTWTHPHDQWKCTGCAELAPFGRFHFIPLPQFLAMIEAKATFTFKNGHPRYTLTDLDHGTHRIHGNPRAHGISRAYVA